LMPMPDGILFLATIFILNDPANMLSSSLLLEGLSSFWDPAESTSNDNPSGFSD